MDTNSAAEPHFRPCTAFDSHQVLASGPLAEVALAVRAASDADRNRRILVFDDTTGRVIDLDLRGTAAEILARLADASAPIETAGELPAPETAEPQQRSRGRPKLGVVAREITLLPRHWAWLGAQPGGASVALRRLVDEARRTGGPRQRKRDAQEAAYRFMAAIAGDLPGFEEAARALFASNPVRFDQQTSGWPAAIRDYASKLAAAAFVAADETDA